MWLLPAHIITNINNSIKYSVEKNAIAISWILRHPANITPVVGTTSIEHLKEMLKAMLAELEENK